MSGASSTHRRLGARRAAILALALLAGAVATTSVAAASGMATRGTSTSGTATSGAAAGDMTSGATTSDTVHGGLRADSRAVSARTISRLAALPVIPMPTEPTATVHTDSLKGVAQGVLGVLGGLQNPVQAGTSELAGIGLSAVDGWVLSGAGAALNATASVIGTTTSPQLRSVWFSSMYWRVAGLGALLTIPFLFAAAVQALLHSDLSLLARAAFAYLPLALLSVSVAAPLAMLLLAATDQMCAAVSALGRGGGSRFLASAALIATANTTVDGSPFLGVIVGVFIVVAAIALLVELLVREAAVYVIVLMLPLAFAAFVWPARRMWAVRAVELLLALILSKFVVVAVLSLGGAAFGANGDSAAQLLTAMALVLTSTFAPWALMRLIPFAEIAAGAGGALRAELPGFADAARAAGAAGRVAGTATDWLAGVSGQLRTQARDAGQLDDGREQVPTGAPPDGEATDMGLGDMGAPDVDPGGGGASPRSDPGPGGPPDAGSSRADVVLSGDEAPSGVDPSESGTPDARSVERADLGPGAIVSAGDPSREPRHSQADGAGGASPDGALGSAASAGEASGGAMSEEAAAARAASEGAASARVASATAASGAATESPIAGIDSAPLRSTREPAPDAAHELTFDFDGELPEDMTMKLALGDVGGWSLNEADPR